MRVLTIEDIKEILHISEKKAKALISTEGFPAIRIGTEYRILEDDLYKWIRDNYSKKIKLDYSKV